MKAVVFSDTHSNCALMLEAAGRIRPDVLIHLGDYERDALRLHEAFPGLPFYSVAGNCDMAASSPETDVVPLGPVKAFITHGHLYNVEWGHVDSLVYAAQEQDCRIALYGHTHQADNQEVGGVKVINPGTAGKGRTPTCAVLEVFENGGIKAEIREL